MKSSWRSRITSVSGFLEIALSIFIIIGIAIMTVELVLDIVNIVRGLFVASITTQYEDFLGDALKLIIGIEFVKMLMKHTPESVVEVLVFAIARKLVVGTFGSLDIVIGIGAIAVLFVIRRFLFTPSAKNANQQAIDSSNEA